MQNYQELAMRTNAPTVGTYGNVPNDLIHATLGIIDEIDEHFDATDDVNALEELGDILWFCALAAETLEVDLMWDDLPMLHQPMLHHAFKIAGLVKKPYAYGTAKLLATVEISMHLRGIIADVALIAKEYGKTIDDLQRMNIAKLQARYPEKFTAEQAYNRDLEAERKVLES